MSEITARLTAALADRYAIEQELGSGGMATVYLAEDLKHHRQVAVKVLRPELAAALGPERFLREIEISARLRHPHILPLYDSGEADGFLYYVMPFVEGESLRDRLEREKQLPVDDALRIAREVADALSYAHMHDVVHRDIKPENILLEANHAVVADFGIARAVTVAGGDRLTQTGTAVGTPSYMSPEQASGADFDGRSDLYSLGCVLYEMLAGQAPFSGPTTESVIHQHLAVDPPAITNYRPGVPGEIVAVLTRALAKTPADRFNPVAQFAEALSHVPSAPKPARVSPVSPRAKARRPAVAVAAGSVIVVLAAFAIIRFMSKGAGDTLPPSVAVLPFDDLSGGDNQYLGDGIAETLISSLSKLKGLKVAARTSAFSFREDDDVRTIGERLSVGAVLEGSVQRAGDRIRVTAQLINAADGFHLWSESFDRGVEDVFAVQDEVARAVVSALEVQLLGDANAPLVARGTEDLGAYDAYLLGRFYWNKRTAEDLEQAADYFQQAIKADSNYAQAWAGLAETYTLFPPSEYDVTSMPWQEALDHGERAARRALAIDSTLAEAYTGLANILEKRKQWREARQTYRRAIQVNPRYPTAHQWYAGFLLTTGQVEDGLREFQAAEQLDPLSMVIRVEVAQGLAVVGHIDAATAKIEELVTAYPEAQLVRFYAWMYYLAVGDVEGAAEQLEPLIRLSGGDLQEASRMAARIRNPTTRRATLLSIADTSRQVERAIAAYQALGDGEGALELLERAADGPNAMYIYHPALLMVLGPELRGHPRAQAALRQLRGEPQ